MSVKVHLNNLRTAPRKTMLIIDLIRGLKVDVAMEQLKYMPQRAAVPIAKLLKSAVAAAQNDYKMNKDDLYISKATVDMGVTLKRSMPRAMGRAFPIMKRTSNIMIELDKINTVSEPLAAIEENKAEGADITAKENSVKKSKKKTN